MIKKKIAPILLAACLSFSTILYGCGTDDTNNSSGSDTTDGTGSVKEDLENAGEDAKNGLENAGDAVKDSAEDALHLGENLVDKTMTYSKDEFKKALDDMGLKVEEVKDRTDHFSVEGEEYTVNGQKIIVYEYDEGDSQKLQDDLDTVSNTGTVSNGTVTNWNGTAHIYKKGRVVVVYEGDDATTLTNLKDILGDPILG